VIQTTTIDLRPQLTSPVLDQGARGTCLAVATSQAHQAARNGAPLAPDALWLTVRGPGPTDQVGIWPHEVADAVAIPGQPVLSVMPLEIAVGVYLQWPIGIANEPFYGARMSIHGGTDAVRDALAANQIAVLVIDVTDHFGLLTPDDTVVDADPVRKSFYSRHAVICVGAGRSDDGGELFLIRNSWGPWWADGGDGWLTAAFLDEHCDEVMRIGEIYPLP
jgi:hypothetical protein